MTILDRICYLSCPKETEVDLLGNKIDVKHTFPYNPSSKTAYHTANHWARVRGRRREHFRQTGVNYIHEPELLERSNSPFAVKIISLDVRSEGGRAYKVIDQENREFDLREDQVLEAIARCGIKPGGEIPGQFVWDVLGSQVRMVFVGGKLHGELLEQTERLKKLQKQKLNGTAPSPKTFKVGHIYKKRDGTLHIFVGKVKHPDEKKTLCAFFKLPSRDDDEINNDIQWNKMTWLERCQHIWIVWGVNAWCVPGITLSSEPKFIEELTDTSKELANVLRNNEYSNFLYLNGYGEDISELFWSKKHGNTARRSYYYQNSVGPFVELDEAVRRDTEEYRKTFQSQLKWAGED